MQRTRAGFVVVVLLLAGCEVPFEAPADARITCRSDAECPSGWFCKPALGRCSQAHDDGSPPALAGTATVTPAFAARGALVTVAFEVSDPLGAPPVIELGTPTRTPFLPYSVDGLRYTYALAVGGAVPEGTFPVLARLVSATGAVAQDLAVGTLQVDATPPAISRVDTLTPHVRAQTSARVEATFGEALAAPPTARIAGGPALVTEATAQPEVWRFRLDVTGTELEGAASVLVEARDAAGNTATRTASDAFVLDFTTPAPVTTVVATPVVRTGQQIVVHGQFSEPLQEAPAARLLGRASAAVIPLAVADRVGTHYTFGATVQPGAAEETYDVQLRTYADLAGNPGEDVAGGAVVIDATPPSLTAGPAPVKVGARYRAGEQPQFTFTASEPLASPPQARLTTTPDLALSCVAGAGRSWTCTLPAALTGAERPESAVKAVFDLVDLAGNAATFSADAVLDFTAPQVVAGSAAADVSPPAGSLVSAVTALRAGARIRVSFAVDEPLDGWPEVVTAAPDPLVFASVTRSGTYHVYEHVLDAGAHAQGSYTVQALLTDHAGNVAARTLALPAPGLRVDTVSPALPDVVTVTSVVYARAPWGTAARGGVPQFTITGSAGAVEPGATVVAYDGELLSASREIGRASAAADGAFAMSLIPADRREVFVLAVDGAGNPSDASGALPGVQAARVRDVAWTATLLGKVAGSTAENPHRLDARSRWLGPLEQGATEEATLPATSRGTLGWTLTATGEWFPDLWASGKGAHVAADARRGRLVVPTPGMVWEWDGEVWTTIQTSGGPVEVTAAVYDARRGEVLVYDGNCGGGTSLWAWSGAEWLPRAQGASYVQWAYYKAPAPGPHRDAFLAYDEARGEVILAPGRQYPRGPYVCGDVYGELDYGTYRWDGTAWELLPGPTTSEADGRLLGFDVSRRVVVRMNAAGMAEWDGTSWTSIDPAGITTGPAPYETGDTVYDPVYGRVLFVDSTGHAWRWSGTSWARAGATPTGHTSRTGNLVRDPAANRAVLLAADGLFSWTGSGFSTLAPVPSVPPSPVGLVYSSARGRMDAFDASGTVYRWLAGRWSPSAVATPPGITGAASMDGAASTVIAAAADDGVWRWDGTSWTSLTPASTTRPWGESGMAYVSGTGPVCMGGAGMLWSWSGTAWTEVGSGATTHVRGPPAAAPALPGVYFASFEPYNPDYRLYRWTSAVGYDIAFSGAGFGTIRPIAADGSDRTFLLHENGPLRLDGATLVPAGAVDPRGVGHPLRVSASAWDPALQAVVVLDGTRTWHLEMEGRSRPGHLFRARWPTGGVGGDCFAPGSACVVRSVDVSWSGQAATNEGAPGTTTVTLSLWNDAQWVTAGSVVATAGVQATRSATVTSPSVLSRLGAGRAPEVDLAVTLPATTFTAPMLRTDDVLVTVRYRLP